MDYGFVTPCVSIGVQKLISMDPAVKQLDNIVRSSRKMVLLDLVSSLIKSIKKILIFGDSCELLVFLAWAIYCP